MLIEDGLFEVVPGIYQLRGFDLSVMSYLVPLLHGASVYTIPKNEIKYGYIAELLEELHDFFLGGNVNAHEGFIKQEDIGLLAEGTGYEHALLLPTR